MLIIFIKIIKKCEVFPSPVREEHSRRSEMFPEPLACNGPGPFTYWHGDIEDNYGDDTFQGRSQTWLGDGFLVFPGRTRSRSAWPAILRCQVGWGRKVIRILTTTIISMMKATWQKYEAMGRSRRCRCHRTSPSWQGLFPLGGLHFVQPPEGEMDCLSLVNVLKMMAIILLKIMSTRVESLF